MEDSPEDLPKPPRRTAARPFFSPRSSGEGVTGPLELSHRRAAQLFTPPGSSPATPAADKAIATEPADQAVSPSISDAADGATGISADAPESETASASDAGEDWIPAPMIAPEHTLDAESLLARRNTLDDDDPLVVEQFEHEDIELTSASASSVPDEHAIEVIAYDDANSLLHASASEGDHPKVDGLLIESTEVSFQETTTPRLNIDSFWATEPFSGADAPQLAAQSADHGESTAAADDSAPAMESAARAQDDVEAQPFTWVEDAPVSSAGAKPAFDASAPPWVSRETPISSQTLEELKESEPWTLTPPFGQASLSDAQAVSESIADEATLDAPVVAAPPTHDVADALERIAARIRGGEIDVPAGSESSDEAALAAALTALLRLPR